MDWKSTTGNIFKLGNDILAWLSRKQASVALSYTQAECISASTITQEIKWLLNILRDLELPQHLPIAVYEDNISAIKLTKNEKAQTRTKHIEVKFHHIKHLSENGVIKITC